MMWREVSWRAFCSWGSLRAFDFHWLVVCVVVGCVPVLIGHVCLLMCWGTVFTVARLLICFLATAVFIQGRVWCLLSGWGWDHSVTVFLAGIFSAVIPFGGKWFSVVSGISVFGGNRFGGGGKTQRNGGIPVPPTTPEFSRP